MEATSYESDWNSPVWLEQQRQREVEERRRWQAPLAFESVVPVGGPASLSSSSRALLALVNSRPVGEVVDAEDPAAYLAGLLGPDAEVRASTGVGTGEDFVTVDVPLLLVRWDGWWHPLAMAHSAGMAAHTWTSDPYWRPFLLHDAVQRPQVAPSRDPSSLARVLLNRAGDGRLESGWALAWFDMLVDLVAPGEVLVDGRDVVAIAQARRAEQGAGSPGVARGPAVTHQGTRKRGTPSQALPAQSALVGVVRGMSLEQWGRVDDPAGLGSALGLVEAPSVHCQPQQGLFEGYDEEPGADRRHFTVHAVFVAFDRLYALRLATSGGQSWRVPGQRASLLLTALGNADAAPVPATAVGAQGLAERLSEVDRVRRDDLTGVNGRAVLDAATVRTGISGWGPFHCLRLLLDVVERVGGQRGSVETTLALRAAALGVIVSSDAFARFEDNP